MKTLIVTKHSKYEYEIEKFKLTHDELVAKYSKEHANLDAIINSHDAQITARKKLQELMPSATLMRMHDLKEQITDYDMIISFGGDNSFTYISHYVGNIPLAGINADPARSLGALCGWSSQNLEQTIKNITDGTHAIQTWPLLSATVDDKIITPALSEYLFAEEKAKDMSRQVIVYRGKEYEQKGGGILAATGAGSTGWYSSVRHYLAQSIPPYKKTENSGVFIVREPFFSNNKSVEEQQQVLLNATLLPDEELHIYSLHDSHGIVTSDCWEDFDFNRGSKAVVKIGEKVLHTIVPVNA